MKKKLLIILLIFALCMSACGRKASSGETAGASATPAASSSPSPSPSPEISEMASNMQRDLLESNRDKWAFTDPYDSPWYYVFTDLDHNGRLEVIAATTQGTGVYTYAHMWEVRSDYAGIENCYHKDVEIEGPDDWPEIVRDHLPCYHDPHFDRYYYPCEGVTREGAASQYYAWYALCLKDGVAEWERLAEKFVSYDDNGDESVICFSGDGQTITEDDYNNAVSARFEGMERTDIDLDWTAVENPWPEESGDGGSSSWLDETEGPAPDVTKDPRSETVTAGDTTWFIANADNADSLTWQLIAPDGNVYSLTEAMEQHPGLELEALDGDTLAVRNIPQSLNGWRVIAVFEGPGGRAESLPASIIVKEP